MPTYEVNDDAVKHAKKLIDDGAFDDETPWSDAAPSAKDANEEIDSESYDEFARWHLAVDTDASQRTQGPHRFPYGDFPNVNRAAPIHPQQRAAPNDHPALEKAPH